jgi:ethanolamine ammonia-lyase small subunit
MAYRPQPGHTDAERNLISNIHARGVAPDLAAHRIAALADQMRQAKTSGVAVKENLTTLAMPPARPLTSTFKASE